MTKQEFLYKLQQRLYDLPAADVRAFLDDYSEIIADRMEEGLTEEDAVAALGSIDEIAARIRAEMPRTAPPAAKRGTLPTWAIVLLIVGAPLWIPLVIAVCAVVFAFLCVLWSVVISLLAVAVAVIASAVGCLVAGGVLLCVGHPATGALCVGVGLICAGLSILSGLAFAAVIKSAVATCRSLFRFIAARLHRKEAVA